jgi:hypothetical protein
MTYNPNIPQSGDDPQQSQGQLLNNFGTINSKFSVNHNPYTNSANPGFHTKINFAAVLATDPNLSSPQSSLYPKNQASTNTTELYFQNNSTAVDVKQLTNLPIANGVIQGITPGTPNIINSNRHQLTTGDTIKFYNIVGAVELNGNTYTITVIDANNFSVVQAGVSAYVSGGYWVWVTGTAILQRYGFLSPWGLIFNMGLSTTSPITFAYPFPTGFTTYYAGITPNSAPSAPFFINSISTEQMIFTSTKPVYYIVIGK